MDIPTATAVLALTGKAVELFDKVADQIARFITKRPDPTGPKQYRYKIEGKQGAIHVTQDGRKLQTLTGEDLAALPKDYLEHITVLEESMRRHYNLWKAVYPKRNDSADLIVNAKIEQQLRDIVLEMKNDLTGIVNFLQSIGVHLDDHYMIMRDVVSQYD
jgi:hypothetical protein